MSDVYVVGVGMTRFGRHRGFSIKDLTKDAVSLAMRDANANLTDLKAAFFSNTSQSVIEGQHMIGGEIALRHAGIERIPVINAENACASGATAFNLAFAYLKAGLADVAIAVGSEKMICEDKSLSMAIFDGAWDVHDVANTTERLTKLGASVTPPAGTSAEGARSVFMDVYAALAKLHMETFGTTQRQLAAISAKNHFNSTLNPLAQYTSDISIDEVLAARVIAWPLTLPMCSPISDGAAAVVLASDDALSRFDRHRAVKVQASVLVSGSDRQPADYGNHACRRAALAAYEKSGLGPEDISVAEVHDASAFGEILQAECLGFSEFGAAGHHAERGDFSLGGRIPINPSGGLESKGHPIGATGLAQIHELVTQLRNEAGKRQVEKPRFALAENGGGLLGCEEAAASVTILGRT